MFRLRAVLLLGVLLVASAAQDPPPEEEEEEEEEEDTEPPPPDGPPLVPMCELSKSHGYKCEEHVVTTKDGYKLDMYHITCDAAPRGPVLLLMHGLMASSEMYTLRNDSIGFQLCDDGIDVWITNLRGSFHGRKHNTLNPNTDGQFWDYGITELGMYDAPASVNYVKEQTKAPQIYYLGHSLGSTTLFTMLSTNPEMAASIKEAILMAPVFYLSKFQGMLKEGASMLDMVTETMDGFKKKELWEAFPRADVEKTEHQIRCTDLPEMAIGYCNMGLDMAKPVIGEYMPAGSSRKMLEHWIQSVIRGKVAFYDYGSEDENTKKYGTPTPPEFDLKKATMKVHLIYCEADHLLLVQDAETLKGELPSPGITHHIESEDFNHGDYVIPSSDEIAVVYNDMVAKVKSVIH